MQPVRGGRPKSTKEISVASDRIFGKRTPADSSAKLARKKLCIACVAGTRGLAAAPMSAVIAGAVASLDAASVMDNFLLKKPAVPYRLTPWLKAQA
jgi:hypothetical protein